MLDTDTKRRIDTARDILVGKVPDPKSQVEQITIALIYKFMDDMDAEAEEFGGKRTFFAGDYARYGWAKLMRSGLGGHEMLNLYGEAIAKMPENPGIPPLFRDIFKNAYLPYRDPETLRAFLKIIDEFEYDHSERLGDAFEYLLSVLGSQGDAGQFRTPRHIIDFMVEIVGPKKDEVILDPACGTAGFLISAYKHILKANSTPEAIEAPTVQEGEKAALDSSKIPPARGDLLTPDERGKMAVNFKGYDISPDMVRLSLVNLYLHGFNDPHIYEYDTLTSQERWNEYADVILANPPFMSPKGGIKPHNRFSVKSKRSEVLFVDYMAEHLSPNGRAAIIVPEGVIFQSQTAYKQLRKLLVDEYLVAVVSLPSGIFNPYAGVKTSILLLDKSLAKKANTIAFFKVENDGFGLGAQRRPIDKNDLPQVQNELTDYLHRLRTRKSVEDHESTHGLIVPKEKIAANGDYNLSGERYRVGAVSISKWPMVSVGEVFRKADKTVLPDSLTGPVTYLGLENLVSDTGEISGNIVTQNPADIKSLKNVFSQCEILYGKLRPNLNKVWLADRTGICSTDIFVITPIEENVDPALYAYLFRSPRFNDAVMAQLKGAQLPRIGWSSFAELQIPLPPLEIQKEIVAEIEGYQKVINGARAVLDNYHPQIPVDPDWPMVEVLSVSLRITKGTTPTTAGHSYQDAGITFLKVESISEDGKFLPEKFAFISGECHEAQARSQLKAGDVLFSIAGALGRVALVPAEILPANTNQALAIIAPNHDQIDPRYLAHGLRTPQILSQAEQQKTGVAQYNLSLQQVGDLTIPLPPLAIQRAIVAGIEAEQALVAANRELITRFEQKIQSTLARVWGDEKGDTAI